MTTTHVISRRARPATSPVSGGIDQYPSNQKLLQNPAYTEFWSLQAVDKWMGARPLTVPTVLVVGQWDQEDSYGGPAVYKALKDKYNDMVSLVIGPWRHSGVNHYGYGLGALTFTGDTAHEFRVKYMKPFFDHYLKGGPDPHMPRALTYATGGRSLGRVASVADGNPDSALPRRALLGELHGAERRWPR